MSGLIFYTTDDGRSQVKLRADWGTVWLTQLDMAELFQASKQNLAKHFKVIFADQELSQESVVNHRFTTAADSKNYRVVEFRMHPIRIAPRSTFSWASSLMQRTSSLYTTYRYFLSSTQLGNCQGTLDSSGTNTSPTKCSAKGRFATRCVVNSIVAAVETTTEESSVVGKVLGERP